MKGFIITYNSSDRKDITKINYFLFGRIATIKRAGKEEKYYYPGFFEGTPYKKIANGCYFVEEINDDLNGLLGIYESEVEFPDSVMLNGRDYWKERIKDKKINNW